MPSFGWYIREKLRLKYPLKEETVKITPSAYDVLVQINRKKSLYNDSMLLTQKYTSSL